MFVKKILGTRHNLMTPINRGNRTGNRVIGTQRARKTYEIIEITFLYW